VKDRGDRRGGGGAQSFGRSCRRGRRRRVAILIERMDHAAYIASVKLAPGKARTAALFKKPSQAFEDAINHGRLAAVTAQGFTEMQGGLPIVVDGEVIGARGELRHAGARCADRASRVGSGSSLMALISASEANLPIDADIRLA
jgi:hypothetical protein